MDTLNGGAEKVYIAGKAYPVLGYAVVEGYDEEIPILDMPVMTDKEWGLLANTPENLAKVAELKEKGVL